MIGYEFLLNHITVRMVPPRRPARVMPVTRVEQMADMVAVPRGVAPPEGAGILEHVLFALKHETMDLAILHEALKLVEAHALLDAFAAQRQSGYLRKAAFLWEKANGKDLALPWPSTGGNYIDMFERGQYYTGAVWERSPRYRISFNGIGPYEFCPVVRRDAALQERGEQVLHRLSDWASNPENSELLDRVMSWAYLAETRDSYAIEHEHPSANKEQAFLDAMAQLRDRTPLSEEYLVGLQNIVVTNDLAREPGFRGHQNWLQRGGHGALSVRYVPPDPGSLGWLADAWMRMANSREGDVPPLVKAALVSFGLVFLHPFGDGNGRLSRLLAHHCLNFLEVLPTIGDSPAILPLSVAMKKHEGEYLAALESFSKPVRRLWDVTYVADNDFLFEFKGSPMAYACWSGTEAAEFVTSCAEESLQQFLMDEVNFIRAYDAAYADVDREFDLPNRTINLLIQWIRQNNGALPRRRMTAAEVALMRPEQIARVEAIVAAHFGNGDEQRPATGE